MIEVKSTLSGETKVDLKPNHLYMIDWSKLESVNDLVLILASMGVVFPSDHPNIEQLIKFLNVDNPIPIAKQPQSNIEERLFKEHTEEKIFNKTI
jgi:hypothetical protein